MEHDQQINCLRCLYDVSKGMVHLGTNYKKKTCWRCGGIGETGTARAWGLSSRGSMSWKRSPPRTCEEFLRGGGVGTKARLFLQFRDRVQKNPQDLGGKIHVIREADLDGFGLVRGLRIRPNEHC